MYVHSPLRTSFYFGLGGCLIWIKQRTFSTIPIPWYCSQSTDRLRVYEAFFFVNIPVSRQGAALFYSINNMCLYTENVFSLCSNVVSPKIYLQTTILFLEYLFGGILRSPYRKQIPSSTLRRFSISMLETDSWLFYVIMISRFPKHKRLLDGDFIYPQTEISRSSTSRRFYNPPNRKKIPSSST